MTWSLYQNNKFLEPLKFSNGKSQEDVVKEVLDEFDKGIDVIFIKGVCGTGKSAIALNIAKELGKSSVVVPGKNLQNQYKRDYQKEKYILKKDKEKLNISVITGRNNHKCQFLEDNQGAIPKIKREINSKLHDIFAGKQDEINEIIGKDISAGNYNIPCKIEIREKNWNRIKKYLKQNKKINLRDFLDIKDVKRISIASVCPYWSPVLPEKYDLKNFGKKKTYTGLENVKYNFYQRKKGCGFYEQFNSYIDSDVIVFNALKYKFESLLGRKPITEVEIIDECDDFLDSFSNTRTLNIGRLQHSLIALQGKNKDLDELIFEILKIIKKFKNNWRGQEEEIFHIKDSEIYELFEVFMRAYDIFYEIDEESYVFDVWEIVRTFDEYLDETYLTVGRQDENFIVSLVTINLEKKFKELLEKNKKLVLMSGTLHSDKVLKDIFGLKKFKVIDAETKPQGKINVMRIGFEMDCRHSNLCRNAVQRVAYLKALDKCISAGKKPILVQVTAFYDLPTEKEVRELKLKNLPDRESLRFSQNSDKTGRDIKEFKARNKDVLFSTKTARGIDFPGQQCNSIIFTKYPNPNIKDAFWKILHRTNKEHYWSFYKDKARRELWQKVYRGLRSPEDHVYVLSPDERVLEFFENSKT